MYGAPATQARGPKKSQDLSSCSLLLVAGALGSHSGCRPSSRQQRRLSHVRPRGRCPSCSVLVRVPSRGFCRNPGCDGLCPGYLCFSIGVYVRARARARVCVCVCVDKACTHTHAHKTYIYIYVYSFICMQTHTCLHIYARSFMDIFYLYAELQEGDGEYHSRDGFFFTFGWQSFWHHKFRIHGMPRSTVNNYCRFSLGTRDLSYWAGQFCTTCKFQEQARWVCKAVEGTLTGTPE